MNSEYEQHVVERTRLGIPPLPLTAAQTEEVCQELEAPGPEGATAALDLLAHRVPPGVDPAAKIKADFLVAVALQHRRSPLLEPERAVELLGTMRGGYNVPPLVSLLDDIRLAPIATRQLKHSILVSENFDTVVKLMKRGNRFARQVLESWAEAEWFHARPGLPESLTFKVYMVKGEVNTDDLSPAGHASTRPDIPLHALSMGESRFPEGIDKIRQYRSAGHEVAFVAHTLGTGSSRKSATNSLIWHIGHDIPHVPNKRQGGVVLAEAIAPIFFNTFEDSGGLPIRCDVDKLRTGRVVTLRPADGELLDQKGKVLARFELSPKTLADEYRAGGRLALIIGRKLTDQARDVLGQEASTVFVRPPAVARRADQGYTLAQKLIGRACGRDGVLPGETCEPAMTTVGSQDTTGPMTRDELVELACLSFQAGLTMQSFCHTAAYPKEKDEEMHRTLPGFFVERGGVALEPGDGIIHSWLNRLILPDTVGTGGDSHTRFPLGISFPAGSGLVAFAAAFGCMPLDVPESVLVRMTGAFREGVTLRDLVNAIPLAGIEQGLVDRPGEGPKNVFNSRILEMEGLADLTVEQAFELTCASAERSAAAATIALGLDSVAQYMKSNVALLQQLIDDGYGAAAALHRRISEAEEWLESPGFLARDEKAEFAATLDIDLADITEPVLACPNLPDRVWPLSHVEGTAVDEVFIGSCMTNIGHFRAAARILADAGGKLGVKRLWIAPPTRMDRDQLAREGVLEMFEKAGARVEIPGCSLCMGNQARVEDKATVFSTSTRNFDNRMGQGAQVYLGSAELAAVVARLGKLPGPAAYQEMFRTHITPHRDAIYRYLNFHESPATNPNSG